MNIKNGSLWLCGQALWTCGGSVGDRHVSVGLGVDQFPQNHRVAQKLDRFADAGNVSHQQIAHSTGSDLDLIDLHDL